MTSLDEVIQLLQHGLDELRRLSIEAGTVHEPRRLKGDTAKACADYRAKVAARDAGKGSARGKRGGR